MSYVLNTHPEIRMRDEEGPLYFIAWLWNGLKGGEHMKTLTPWYNPVLRWKCSQFESMAFRDILIDKWMEVYYQWVGPGFKYIGDKWCDFIVRHFDFFDKRLKPKWIIMERNKEDTLASMAKANWNGYKTYDELVFDYEKATQVIDDNRHREDFYVVKYEDMCKDPVKTFDDISKYLGVENKFDTSWVNVKKVS
jgi:hypothetical protein